MNANKFLIVDTTASHVGPYIDQAGRNCDDPYDELVIAYDSREAAQQAIRANAYGPWAGVQEIENY